MKNPPQNIKAARRKRYVKASWNPSGHSYIEECCAFEVISKSGFSIITSFTARLYGLRRSKRKTEKIIKELRDDS